MEQKDKLTSSEGQGTSGKRKTHPRGRAFEESLVLTKGRKIDAAPEGVKVAIDGAKIRTNIPQIINKNFKIAIPAKNLGFSTSTFSKKGGGLLGQAFDRILENKYELKISDFEEFQKYQDEAKQRQSSWEASVDSQTDASEESVTIEASLEDLEGREKELYEELNQLVAARVAKEVEEAARDARDGLLRAEVHVIKLMEDYNISREAAEEMYRLLEENSMYKRAAEKEAAERAAIQVDRDAAINQLKMLEQVNIKLMDNIRELEKGDISPIMPRRDDYSKSAILSALQASLFVVQDEVGDMTVQQLRALILLMKQGNLTVTAIHNLLGINKPTASRIVTVLSDSSKSRRKEENRPGLVTFVDDPTDARVKQVVLTDFGKHLAKRIVEIVNI